MNVKPISGDLFKYNSRIIRVLIVDDSPLINSLFRSMLDHKAGDLVINTEKLNNEGLFNFYMTRITDETEDEFSAEEIALKEGALVYINYAEWTDANPEGIYFGVDLNGDGTINDEYVVDDRSE